MSPTHSRTEARRTRERILDHAVAVASVDGLDGLRIGKLAEDLRLSKAGVVGPFGGKEGLQLAVLERAAHFLERIMLTPAKAAEPGLPRLRALVEGWLRYIGEEREIFPGGCLFTTAAVEFDSRGGSLHDAVLQAMSTWRDALAREARAAVEVGQLPPGTDPDQVGFELIGIFTSMNMAVQLFHDPSAGDRATTAVDRLLSPHAPA
ncbi:TetR/AcrR family transcriptional regulator [Streptomyces sp. NPDC047002]|uniref:TetR/AcrR family transcriptional regulator n=1 Tax=Streptomyces sp. NPDC047002 TaxID=3155475 RepID=UPI003455E0F9